MVEEHAAMFHQWIQHQQLVLVQRLQPFLFLRTLPPWSCSWCGSPALSLQFLWWLVVTALSLVSLQFHVMMCMLPCPCLNFIDRWCVHTCLLHTNVQYTHMHPWAHMHTCTYTYSFAETAAHRYFCIHACIQAYKHASILARIQTVKHASVPPCLHRQESEHTHTQLHMESNGLLV